MTYKAPNQKIPATCTLRRVGIFKVLITGRGKTQDHDIEDDTHASHSKAPSIEVISEFSSLPCSIDRIRTEEESLYHTLTALKVASFRDYRPFTYNNCRDSPSSKHNDHDINTPFENLGNENTAIKK